MALTTTRRQFLKQTAFAAAGLYGPPIKGISGARCPGVRGQNGASLDPTAIRKLVSQISGHVITPETPDYESSRLVFNRAFDRHPALIVRCAGAPDVARALEFAQNQNLPLAVRGGGHSRAGFGMCDGGMVIDLSGMNGVEVNAGRRVARAGAGSLVRDVDQATQRFGLATTLGGCATVGIAGLTLGGGEGLLQSKYGAACDNLLSARVVTVDGRELEASQKSNPDLFWAIRGGGGNFGIVTSFEYRLHPVSEVLSGALTYPGVRIPDALQAFGKFTAAAPDEIFVLGEVLPSKQGPKLLIHLRYSGDPRLQDDLLRPLRVSLKPQEDDVKIMSYLEAQGAALHSAPFAHFETNLFFPELSAGTIAAITTAINDAPPQYGC